MCIRDSNQVAACFYGYPSKKMVVYGVTGTNGKSSIACMIRNLLNPVYALSLIHI